MRELTIRRDACFWGKRKKDTVYIEDWEGGDVSFGQTPCRKLGEIRNGETKTFSIGEKLARVFVAGKKNRYDYCELPSGTEDVSLSGSHVPGDPAFRFHGELEGYSQEERSSLRKGQKVHFYIKMAVFALGFLLAFLVAFNYFHTAKDFTVKELTITLTEDFSEEYAKGFVLNVVSPEVLCCAERIAFADAPHLKNFSAKDLAELLISENNFEGEVYAKTHGDLVYFEAPNKIAGTEYHCFLFPMKSGEAVWILQFATHFTDAETYREQIFAWAESVEFAD